MTDPSGYDPYWCDEQSNPELCYAKWIIDHGGKPNTDILEVYYDWSPEEALDMLQDYFDIKLPNGIDFRFAYSGYGEIFIDQRIGGYNPWFFDERYPNSQIYVLEYRACMVYSNSSLANFDNTLYITSAAFESYDFYPDDIAAITIHEGVHAWQESVALQQVGLDVLTDTWYYRFRNGLERQAYQVVFDMDGSRLRLLNYRKRVEKIIGDYYRSRDDSPLIPPIGVP